MSETQNENQTLHFSKNILILAILFIILNIGLFAMIFFRTEVISSYDVAPKILIAKTAGVSVKTPFSASYEPAKSGQSLISGSFIKSDDLSIAELDFDQNRIRLDKNTIIQVRSFAGRGVKADNRLSLALISGGLWINAYDPVQVLTEQSSALFSHTVGAYTYSGQFNKIFSVMGNIDVTLFNQNNVRISGILVPLKNQISYADSQIQPVYSKLEYSKLKKELKMIPVSKDILNDEWVKDNTSYDMAQALDTDYIFSDAEYDFSRWYHNIRSEFALIPSVKTFETLSLADVQLKYILGALNKTNDTKTATDVLSQFDSAKLSLSGNPYFLDLAEKYFYKIRNIRTDTPAYMVKENLRNYIYSINKDPSIFSTYLADTDFLLKVGELSQAEKVADKWMTSWKEDVRKKYPAEFEGQSRIYHSILLAYIEKVTPKFLTILDDIGDYKIHNSGNPDGSLYEVALDRLEISKYLVSVYRYVDAKTYLKTSYSKLNLSQQPDSVAAREIFIQEATLLGDRIAFAEQNLRGSADRIDESKFRAYLDEQARDKTIAERFTAFMQENQKQPEQKIVPTKDEAVGYFASSGITVLPSAVVIDPNNPFQFIIQQGRFNDRASDGSPIVFSATFDYSTKALFNIVLNEKNVKGNFSIEDFITIAKFSGSENPSDKMPVSDISDLADYLNLNNGEDAARSQVVAQDLAIQLVIKELERYKVLIPSAQQVVITDKSTLSLFRIEDVNIEDPVKRRRVQVTFDYNSNTKMVSSIFLKGGISLDLPSQIKADEFTQNVFENLYAKENEVKQFTDSINELAAYGIDVEANNIEFIGTDYMTVKFGEVRLKSMPVTLSGSYDRRSKIFLSAQNALLTSQNVAPAEYIKQLSLLWVLDYLSSKGIQITQENISTVLPADKVVIKNYKRGTRIIDMVYDVKSNKLTNIQVLGISAVVPSMTFEEFSLIQGGSDKPTVIAAPSGENTASINSAPNGNCNDFADRLKDCVKYSCELPNVSGDGTLLRRISGYNGDKCRYLEQLPDNKYMECNFSPDMKTAIAQQVKDQLTLNYVITGANYASASGSFSYSVNGVSVTNPFDSAVNSNECVFGNLQ